MLKIQYMATKTFVYSQCHNSESNFTQHNYIPSGPLVTSRSMSKHSPRIWLSVNTSNYADNRPYFAILISYVIVADGYETCWWVACQLRRKLSEIVEIQPIKIRDNRSGRCGLANQRRTDGRLSNRNNQFLYNNNSLA